MFIRLSTTAGLSAALDACLVDLLAEGEPVASLRDASASLASGKLKRHPIEQAEAIYQVCLICNPAGFVRI